VLIAHRQRPSSLPYVFSILLIVIALLLTTCSKEKGVKRIVIKTETIKVDSLSQVILLKDTLVRPILYTHVRGIHLQPVGKAKKIFVSVMLPSILVAKYHVARHRERIDSLSKKGEWNLNDSLFYMEMKSRYKSTTIKDLLNRMITLPNSLILAQAAIESGWGQSHFFLEANNVFGIWSYNRNEPRLRARKNGSVHLKVYENISQSIEDYLEVIGSARSYQALRNARLKSDDPFVLLPHLKYYSISRERYTKALKTMIKRNNFTRYDHFQIDPAYLVAE
jgi:Bax protein